MTGKKAKVEGEDTHIWGLQLWNKYGKWEVTVKEVMRKVEGAALHPTTQDLD